MTHEQISALEKARPRRTESWNPQISEGPPLDEEAEVFSGSPGTEPGQAVESIKEADSHCAERSSRS